MLMTVEASRDSQWEDRTPHACNLCYQGYSVVSAQCMVASTVVKRAQDDIEMQQREADQEWNHRKRAATCTHDAYRAAN